MKQSHSSALKSSFGLHWENGSTELVGKKSISNGTEVLTRDKLITVIIILGEIIQSRSRTISLVPQERGFTQVPLTSSLSCVPG